MARTRFSDIARTFKPNLASLGYALFLAINAAGVWGGVFPFLPMNFQTPEITFWFFLAQSLVFSLCYFASAVGVYYFPGPTRKFIVMLASTPYLLGWCCLIGAIYVHDAALPLVVAGGALLGLGSAGFYMLWQRLFASLDADRGNHDLILGTAYGALLYFALYAIPQAVTAFLIPLVFMPLFALAITLKSREIDLRQPMFDDIPRDHPQVYRRVLRDYWRPALCIGAMAFCAGVMRALAIGEPQVGSLVNMMSMLGSLVAGALTTTFTASQSQNGYGYGDLSSWSVDADGVLYGVYSNGVTLPLWQIPLYDFNCPPGLRREGNNLFSQTRDSGEPKSGPAGVAGLGTINGNTLEQSNVDMSTEFVQMISTQRGFQSNSKIITTTDTMLDTVINMKR